MGHPISPRARIEFQCRAISRINGRPSAKGRCEQQLRGPWANLFSSRSAADQRGSLRTRRSQVQVLPGAPLSPRSPTRRRRSAQNGDSAGANPAVGTISPCSPTSRGAPLKTERLRVQIPPWGPLFAPVAQLAEAANLRSALCRCKSGLEHFFGACTGQANRDSVLTRSVGAR